MFYICKDYFIYSAVNDLFCLIDSLSNYFIDYIISGHTTAKYYCTSIYSPFDSISFCFIYFGALLLSVLMFIIVCSYWMKSFISISCHYLSLVKIYGLEYILPYICIATPTLIWIILAWNIFYAFTFNQFVSLDLKWVFHRQCIYSWIMFYFIYSANLCAF